MERDEATDPSDLQRPDGNGLKANYKLHDIGEEAFVERIESHEAPLSIVPWGIDMRDDDGDGIIYDDKMDFKVTHDGETLCLIDVKTKGSPRYMGRFNERHYVKYHDHARENDVPVLVVMYQVDYDTDAVHDAFVFEIDGCAELYERVHTSHGSRAVNAFPDGNEAVLVPHDVRQPVETLEARIDAQLSRRTEYEEL